MSAEQVEPLTFRFNGDEVFLENKDFPCRVNIIPELLQDVDNEILNRDGNEITVTLANGLAHYEVEHEDRYMIEAKLVATEWPRLIR